MQFQVFVIHFMKRTNLRNKFLNDRTEENRNSCASQRNYCVSLLKKTKKEYFGNLNKKMYATTKHSGKQ